MNRNTEREEGSIELIVLGLLAALIVVLAIPALKTMGNVTSQQLSVMASDMQSATSP